MAKETKTILKEVREAIKAEQFTVAIEKCQNLLQHDAKNYMAYLLLGAAYQTINKAEASKCLRKAIECSPASPLVALQGLSNCATVDELPKVYEQLLELSPERFSDYYEKIFALAANASVSAECLTLFKQEVSKRASDEPRWRLALTYLGRLWLDSAVPPEDEQLFKTALEELIKDVALDRNLTVYKRYLRLLYKLQDHSTCLKYACDAVALYPKDIYAYEWICKIYCEQHRAGQSAACLEQLKLPIEHYAEALLNLNADSSLALQVKAINLFSEHKYVACRDLLYRVLQLSAKDSTAMELLARTQMEIGAYEMALMLWQELGKFEEPYAVCLSHLDKSERLREAVELLLKYELDDNTVHALARCYYKLNELDNLKALNLDNLAKAEYLMSPNEALEFLQTSGHAESFHTLLLMGKLHYKTANFSASLTAVLKATRLKPYAADCFLLLGKIYFATNDVSRACKCFEKCTNLNPLCDEAVNCLSAIYQEMGEEELNAALLLNTLKYLKSERAKHVQFRLGLHYLGVNKWDDAIQAFRTAIKLDVSSMIYWESLGDAYCERGSYNSAIRVFQKILEMDPGNIYAKLKIASIKTTTRVYTEAIEDFANLLKDHPNYLPGLKGAAEAHMGLAQNMKLEHRYGRCKDHLQLAFNHVQRAFLDFENPNMVWLWRLAANLFVQTALMPTSLAHLEVSGKLAKCEAESVHLDSCSLLNLAKRFYICALRIKENTFLWYELALCCYHIADALPEQALINLELAEKAAKMAIKLESSRWQNWNFLGVINMHGLIKNLPLAQHCFIQALTMERKSYTAWTNLGALYLHLGDIKLANQCFKRAQQSSPVYANAWIGQAMIAEAICDDEEAFDLFRHCQQFEYHPEAALGYAHWVCKVLRQPLKSNQKHYQQAFERLYADIVALDVINRYTSYEEDKASAAAWSFQGFLHERQRQYGPALKAYLKAISVAAPGVESDTMYTNLGFLLLKLEKPQEASKAFNSVVNATFRPLVGLALAYMRAEQYSMSRAVYDTILENTSDDERTPSVMLAMASMLYAAQEHSVAQEVLLKCLKMKNSPNQSIYATCAFGLLSDNLKLFDNLVTDLQRLDVVEASCPDAAYLRAEYCAHTQHGKDGITYLKSRLHIFPNNAALRKVVADYMLRNVEPSDPQYTAISQMALSVIELEHSSKTRNCKRDGHEDARTLMVASLTLLDTNITQSFNLLQRAIRLNPQFLNAWEALASLCA